MKIKKKSPKCDSVEAYFTRGNVCGCSSACVSSCSCRCNCYARYDLNATSEDGSYNSGYGWGGADFDTLTNALTIS